MREKDLINTCTEFYWPNEGEEFEDLDPSKTKSIIFIMHKKDDGRFRVSCYMRSGMSDLDVVSVLQKRYEELSILEIESLYQDDNVIGAAE